MPIIFRLPLLVLLLSGIAAFPPTARAESGLFFSDFGNSFYKPTNEHWCGRSVHVLGIFAFYEDPGRKEDYIKRMILASIPAAKNKCPQLRYLRYSLVDDAGYIAESFIDTARTTKSVNILDPAVAISSQSVDFDVWSKNISHPSATWDIRALHVLGDALKANK